MWPLPANWPKRAGLHVAVGELHQIGVWDQPARDPRGRYVAFAYVVIVPEGTAPITAGDNTRTARWWPRTSCRNTCPSPRRRHHQQPSHLSPNP
ncbi:MULTISPECIES: hypothetical protein [unclassified Streptomyces]|uniref:hypothetical protein n=1 Tax=unclassified Streptomyces TaxID=2593676 RepID=UPI00288412BF|nr:hypothetical protein [Streptomyces sp. DSM 41633]